MMVNLVVVLVVITNYNDSNPGGVMVNLSSGFTPVNCHGRGGRVINVSVSLTHRTYGHTNVRMRFGPVS